MAAEENERWSEVERLDSGGKKKKNNYSFSLFDAGNKFLGGVVVREVEGGYEKRKKSWQQEKSVMKWRKKKKKLKKQGGGRQAADGDVRARITHVRDSAARICRTY